MVDPKTVKVTEKQQLELVKSRLLSISDLRKFYDRSGVLDLEERGRFVNTLKARMLRPVTYTVAEKDVLVQGEALKEMFELSLPMQVKSNSPLVKFELAKGRGLGRCLGRASTIIRGEHLEVSWEFFEDDRVVQNVSLYLTYLLTHSHTTFSFRRS
jgi:hypothetical protein